VNTVCEESGTSVCEIVYASCYYTPVGK
jgi:hypothetical protein